LWDVAPFRDGRGGVYVRPWEVEVIEGLGPVPFSTPGLEIAARIGLRPDQAALHKAVEDA